MSDQSQQGSTASSGRRGVRRLLPRWRTLVVGFIAFVTLCIALFAAGYLLVDIPPANAAAKAQSNIYLYSDGTEIARTGEVNRESVPLDEVPRKVQQAVLAAEDRDFYHESAVNPLAMGRAAWNTVRGGQKQSGSTITQQYVKNYYLNQEQTLSRKAKEFFIAIKLDQETTKDEILEGYLNTSYYGRNAYGIQAAAHAYFGKDVSEVTVAEGAYLATLLNAPSVYDVVANPEGREAAESRWRYTLDGMVEEGWLTPAERAEQKFPVPDEIKPPTSLKGQDGYLVEAAKKYLIDNEIVDERTLAAGGFRITTSIDRKKQNAFVKAVDEQLMDELSDKRKIDKMVRAGGASIDPKNGRVVALYGGIDFTKQYVNNATRHDYQVGSTFKPFIFAAAVDHGARTLDGVPITANTVYDGTNKREVQSRDGGTGYAPENEDQRSYGQISAARAMNSSVNSVYAQMAQDVGTKRVKDTAVALGLPEKTPSLTENPSMALGTASASVLEMTSAYATLANHGRHVEPWLVSKVTKDGVQTPVPERKATQAVDREAADATTEVLRGVIDGPGATGAAALGLGRPAAGKTGTAEEDRAAWFAAYTPRLSTVVAVMGQDPNPPYAQKPLYGAAGLDRVNGGGFPAEIWTAYMTDALKGSPVRDFDLELGDAGYTPPPETPETPDVPDSPDPTTGGNTSPPPSDPPTTDEGTTQGDGGTTDGGTGSPTVGGTTDGGTIGGPTNGGTTDGGTTDGGTTDGGTTDGGTTEGDGGTTLSPAGGPTGGRQDE